MITNKTKLARGGLLRGEMQRRGAEGTISNQYGIQGLIIGHNRQIPRVEGARKIPVFPPALGIAFIPILNPSTGHRDGEGGIVGGGRGRRGRRCRGCPQQRGPSPAGCGRGGAAGAFLTDPPGVPAKKLLVGSAKAGSTPPPPKPSHRIWVDGGQESRAGKRLEAWLPAGCWVGHP